MLGSGALKHDVIGKDSGVDPGAASHGYPRLGDECREHHTDGQPCGMLAGLGYASPMHPAMELCATRASWKLR